MPEFIKEITDKDFEKLLLESEFPVMAFFHATVCCSLTRNVLPVVRWARDTYGKELMVRSLNLDECGDLYKKYEIKAVPMVIIFWWGEVFVCYVGGEAKPLQDFLKETMEKIEKEGRTRERYPCKICQAEDAFGSRYLKSDKKRKEFDVCISCAIKERKRLAREFEEILQPEQRELYEKYVAAESRVSSIFILD